MEPLTNKPTDQELIKVCEANLSGMIGILKPERIVELAELLSRFKSLTENRSELVEKCVEAVKGNALTCVASLITIDQSSLRTALTQVLNPEKK